MRTLEEQRIIKLSWTERADTLEVEIPSLRDNLSYSYTEADWD